MKKKTLSLALALVMCLGLTVPALAAESDFVIRDGILTAYTGAGGDVVIPDGVTGIDSATFLEYANVTSVTFPDSLTDIGPGAFAYCTGLTSVVIPEGVTSVGNGAFSGCTGLTSATIPTSLTAIVDSMFADCTNLTSITIPDGVLSVGPSAFSGCAGLTSVTLPNSVTEIGDGAFAGCFGLTTVTIPGGVASIGPNTFAGCEGIKDIYYGGDEARWNSIVEDPFGELSSATIHYNNGAGTPTQPATPPVIEVENIPASGTAIASTQTVTVDSEMIEFQMYALADANGNLTNYIKLRDMAYVLNATPSQFSVGYDGIISLTTGQPYEAGGTEMTTPYSGDRAYTGGPQTLKIDGKDVTMTAITLTDDNGGGYNYFKLRDLGKALGFNVGYSNESGVFIESGKPYAE